LKGKKKLTNVYTNSCIASKIHQMNIKPFHHERQKPK
jgi:hypothetical protein